MGSSGGGEDKSGGNLMESIPSSSMGEKAYVGDKRDRKGAKKYSSKDDGWLSNRDTHILQERERRKRMINMFSGLQDLLPQLPPKTDKCTIIDVAVNYIAIMEQTLQELEERKLDLVKGKEMSSAGMQAVQTLPLVNQETKWSAANSPTRVSISGVPHCFQTWSSPNVVLNINGEDAHISICATTKPGLLATIFTVIEKHNLEVVTAQISSDYFRSMYMIHARVTGASDQFPEELMSEDIFKSAVSEMLLWISA